MTWTIEDYEVYTKDGVIQSVKRTDGASIPADLLNSDYYEFTIIDTENHLCTRTEMPVPEVIEPEIPVSRGEFEVISDVIAAIIEGTV